LIHEYRVAISEDGITGLDQKEAEYTGRIASEFFRNLCKRLKVSNLEDLPEYARQRSVEAIRKQLLNIKKDITLFQGKLTERRFHRS